MAVTLLRRRRAAWLATSALALLALPATAQELPSGGSVAAGQAGIQTNANSVVVRQTSDRAVVNWNSFGIGQGQSVSFEQPNAGSAILNRVTGADISRIAGNLSSNGQVFLLNRNGIVITPTGIVDARGGFIASTLNLRDEDFLAGNLVFEGGGGSIINQGGILTGSRAAVALIGGRVSNEGVITAPLGRVMLASGSAATLDLSGRGYLQVAVPDDMIGDDGQPLIDNSGRISADGGLVVLRAATARNIVRRVINLSGIVEAKSVSGSDGAVVLDGGAGGTTEIGGRIDVSGDKGGRIDVTGGDIKLTGATLDASGATRGGLVRVGGEFQGGHTSEATSAAEIDRFTGRFGAAGDLASAATTTVDSASVIDVSGTDGGSAILWSDLRTDQRGTIRAGSGAVELSSKGVLSTSLDRVLLGQGGKLLLDPKDIYVNSPIPGGETEATLPVTYADNSGGTSHFAGGTISTLLEGGTDVILRASNDIFWNANMSIGLGVANPGHLTLRAGRSVSIGAFLAMANSNLTIVANDSLANGVVDADRDAGPAVIDTFNGNLSGGVGSGSTGGHISLTVGTGAGLTNNAVGTSRLGELDGTSLTINSGTGAMQTLGGGDLTWRGREGVTITGNFLLQTTSLTVTGQTVNWTNESTGTLRGQIGGGAGIKFVENGVTTRLGLIGSPASGVARLTLGAGGSAPQYTKVYGSADPSFAPVNFTSGALQGSHTLTTLLTDGSLSFAGGTSTSTTPGDYTITTSATGTAAFGVTLGAGQGGYFIDLRQRTNTLRITPKALTPTVSNGSYVYGSPTSVVSLAGVINGDTVAPVVSWSAGANQTLGTNGGGFGFAQTTSAGSSTFSVASLAGANAANYTLDLSGTIAGTLAISQKPLTYQSFNATSVYGTAPTPTIGLDGIVGADVVTAGTLLGTRDGTTAALAGTTGVGAYTITLGSLGGAAAGNYSVSPTGNTIGTQTITAKPISFSVANASSTYGTLAVVPSSVLTGLVNGDSVTGAVEVRQGGTPVALAERSNAGAYELTVATLGGAGAANYSIAGAGNTNGTLTISPKALGLAITGATQVYGTPASIVSLTGVLSGDAVAPTVNLGGSILALTPVDSGFGVEERLSVASRSFTLTGLSGAAAGNYSVATGGTGTLGITARPITYTIASLGSTYGDLVSPGATLNGLLSGDSVTAAVKASSGATPVTLAARTPVGSYALAADTLSGAQAGNYVLAGVGNTNGMLTISPRPVTYSIGNAGATYGTLATIGMPTLANVVSGDTLTASVSVLAGGTPVALTDRSNAGAYSLEVLSIGGAAVGNYVLATAGNSPGTLTIAPKSLTYSVANATSVYGSSTHTPGAVTFAGLLSGDSVAPSYRYRSGNFDIIPTAALFASTLDVSVSGLGGAAGGNYSIAGAGNVNGTLTITPRPINYVIGNSSSTYGDVGNFGGFSNSSLIGVVNDDIVFLQSPLKASDGTVGGFNNRDNAGTFTISPAGTLLGGGHAPNYVIATTGNVDGTHVRAPRTVSAGITLSTAAAGALGSSITYGSAKGADIVGTLTLPQFGNGASLPGDTVTASVSIPALKTSAAGYLAAGSYSFTGGALSGPSASNYVLAPTTRTLTVDPKSLGFNLTSATSTYGTLANIGTATATGLLAGDAVAGGTFTAVRRGSTTPVAISATTAAGTYDLNVATLTGADAANYVGGTANATLTINPKALTYAIAAATSTYGTLATPGAVTLSGVVGGDAVQGTASIAGGLLAETGAGTYVQILQGLSGAAASNYVAAATGNSAGTLTIARKQLGYTVTSKNIAGVYGVRDTPAVTLEGRVGSFDNVSVTVNATNAAGLTRELYEYVDVGSYALSLARRNGEYALAGVGAANYVLPDDGVTSFATFTQSPLTLNYRVAGGTSVYGSTIQPAITLTGFPDYFAPGLRPATAVALANAAGNVVGYGATTAVGSYTTVATLVGRDANNFRFAETGNSGSALTVTPRPLALTVAPATATYGDTGARILFGLDNAVPGDDIGLAFNTTAPALTKLGTGTDRSFSISVPRAATTYSYTVTGLAGGAMSNYTLTGGAGATSSLTVAPKTLTYSVAAVTGQYGARTTTARFSGSIFGDPGFTTGAVTLNGVVSGDTLTPTVRLVSLGGELLTHGERTPVGTYFQVMTAVSGDAAANYRIAEAGNTANPMVINKAKITYTVSDGGRIYSNGTAITTGTPGNVTLDRGSSIQSNGTVTANSPIVAGDQVSTAVVVKTVGGAAASEPLAPGFYRLHAVIFGPDAGNYDLFEGFNTNEISRPGVFSVADETLFQFGFIGGSDPSKIYVAPSPPQPAAAPLVSSTASADGTTTTTATIGLTGGSATAGAAGNVATSVSVGQVTLSAAASATTSALAKFGVTGATVSAQVSAAVEVRLAAGPAFVSYNAGGQASGSAVFSLSSSPSLTLAGLASAQASQTGGVGGDLGSGVAGQTAVTATAFAQARNTTSLGIVDGALKIGQEVFVGVGGSAGISGGLSGGGVAANASVKVYSPGSLGAGAAATGGYSNQTVTLGFTLSLSIGIGGLEISPSFSFSTALFEDIGESLFGISTNKCDAGCQQRNATAAATNKAREMYRTGGLTMELMGYLKANPAVTAADNNQNADFELAVITNNFKSLANTPQDIADAAKQGAALLAKFQSNPASITPADMEAAIRLRNKENALVKNAALLGLKVAAVDGQLALVPIAKSGP